MSTSSAVDFAKSLACTATSCSVADSLCLPLDMLKVRMQLQNELAPPGVPRLGFAAMAVHVARTEGVGAFYVGLPAAVMRQSTYGGLCFASYPVLRDALSPSATAADAPLWARIVAGAVAGASAAALANPTDVVKVRLQADGRLQALEGTPPRYSSTGHAFAAILRVEGLAAFWRGTLPNVQRATVVNGAGIAAYDHSKQTAKDLLGEGDSLGVRFSNRFPNRPACKCSPRRSALPTGDSLGVRFSNRFPNRPACKCSPRRSALPTGDSLGARFVAALAGGVVTSLAGTPFDVLKTRMMNQGGGVQANYTGTLSCALATVHAEGVLALWKGLLPVYCRQAPFNML